MALRKIPVQSYFKDIEENQVAIAVVNPGALVSKLLFSVVQKDELDGISSPRSRVYTKKSEYWNRFNKDVPNSGIPPILPQPRQRIHPEDFPSSVRWVWGPLFSADTRSDSPEDTGGDALDHRIIRRCVNLHLSGDGGQVSKRLNKTLLRWVPRSLRSVTDTDWTWNIITKACAY